jgi:ribosomal protein S18 acetylase RimI-like enzyme
MSHKITFEDMHISHYNEVLDLWHTTRHISVSEIDSYESVSRYIERNPGLCSVALRDNTIIGAILCGHDGRRAHINHLAVSNEHRKTGVGSTLVKRCLERLRELDIKIVYLSIYEDNLSAKKFWENQGWKLYSDVYPDVTLLCNRL